MNQAVLTKSVYSKQIQISSSGMPSLQTVLLWFVEEIVFNRMGTLLVKKHSGDIGFNDI